MNEDTEKELSALRDKAAGFRAKIDNARADIISASNRADSAEARKRLKEATDGLHHPLVLTPKKGKNTMATTPATLTHASWGVDSTITVGAPYTGCVVADFNESTEAQHANETDQNGAVVCDTVYDQKTTIQVTLQVPSGLTHPTPGTMITINGKACELISVNEIQSNRDYKKVQLNLEYFPNLTSSTVSNLTSSAS